MVKESWNDIGAELIGYFRMDCQYCSCNRPGKTPNKSTQGAHALVYKRVYNKRRKHKYINVRENFMPCCDQCQKFSETYEGRKHAWRILCDWYGRKLIKDWYDGLNLRVPEVFE